MRAYLERPGLHVLDDRVLVGTTTDKTLGIKDGVGGVASSLVASGLTDETVVLGESNHRGNSELALIIGDDLNLAVPEND